MHLRFIMIIGSGTSICHDNRKSEYGAKGSIMKEWMMKAIYKHLKDNKLI